MTPQTWNADLDFKDDSSLCKKLYESPIITSKHKKIEIDETIKKLFWDRYLQSSWIYEGFIECFENWFVVGFVEPWSIQRQKGHEVHLSGYTEEPTFGANYNLYYNSVNIGSLEVDPYTPSILDNKDVLHKNVYYYAQIYRPDLIPYEKLVDLYKHLTMHDNDKNVKNELFPYQTFLDTLLEYNWERRRGKYNKFDSKYDYITIRGFGKFSIKWLLEDGLISKKILEQEEQHRKQERTKLGLP